MLEAGTLNLYIYYRIADAHAVDARAAVERTIDAMRRQFPVSGQLLRAQNDAMLWMEIYENVAEPVRFEAALNATLAQTHFASWLAPGSMRRTERFVALDERAE